MSLSALRKNTSPIEVTHVSNYGVWLLAGDRELFMSYEHFYWPDLDVDLSEEIITHPSRFPVKAK